MPDHETMRRRKKVVVADPEDAESLASKLVEAMLSQVSEGDFSVLVVAGEGGFMEDEKLTVSWRHWPMGRAALHLAVLIGQQVAGTVVLRTHHDDNDETGIITQTVRSWDIGDHELGAMYSEETSSITMTDEDWAEMPTGVSVRFEDTKAITVRAK